MLQNDFLGLFLCFYYITQQRKIKNNWIFSTFILYQHSTNTCFKKKMREKMKKNEKKEEEEGKKK